MQTVLLIRHGESLSNAGLPTSSAQNVPLTKLGEKQAEYIAEYLKSQFPLDLIVTSSYARSKQTAKTTMSSFPHVLQKEWLVQEFTFLFLNPTDSSTIDERRPHVDEYWNTRSPSYVDGPEVESFEQFINRASQVMMDLKDMKEYKTIAVFSHVQFICALLWLLQQDPVNLSRETMQEFRKFLKVNWLVNGAIVRVQFGNSDDLWQYEIITSHLQELEDAKDFEVQKEAKELEEPKELKIANLVSNT